MDNSQLTVCATQLTWGKIYLLFPAKRVFMSSVVLFQIGSLISAAAPNSNAFIAGRAVSGVGSAGMTAGSMLIMAQCVPLLKRPMFIGTLGAMEAIGYIMGPLLGGAITDGATWRWCFWINLPVGAITAIVIQLLLKAPKSTKINETLGLSLREKAKRFDWLGFLILGPAILSLILALHWGGSKYPWRDARIIAPLVIGAVLLVVFFVLQIFLSPDVATIPIRVLKSRSVIFGALFSFCLSGALAIWTYYLPLWFQVIKGASALDTGVMLLPAILGLITGVGAGSGLVTWIGYFAPLAILSGILSPVAAGFLTMLEVDTPNPEWIGYLIFIGVACGLGFQMPQIAVQTVCSDDDVPAGTALVFFSQSMASAIFISAGNSIFLNSLIDKLKEKAPEISSKALLAGGATTLKEHIPAKLLGTVMYVYNDSITDVFYASLAMCAVATLLAWGMEWKSVKKATKEQKMQYRKSFRLSHV